MKLKTKVVSADCESYRPGDPEFDALASLVTPQHKIMNEFCGERTYTIKKRLVMDGEGMKALMIYMRVV